MAYAIVNIHMNEQLIRMYNNQNLAAFQHLLERGTNPDHEYESHDGYTCLVLACQEQGREKYVEALLKAGASPNLQKPLLHASNACNFKAIKLLLGNGQLDVNVAFENNRTVLHALCMVRCEPKDTSDVLECINLLLDRVEMEVNKPDDGANTALMLAVENLNEEQVEVMLRHPKHQLNLDIKVMAAGQTVREMICCRFSKLARILPIQETEDINSPEPQTRLLAALQNGDLKVFKGILNEMNSEGNSIIDANYFYGEPYYSTCLEMACRMGECQSFVEALCDAGVDPRNYKKVHGVPLIHFVVDSFCQQTLELLIKRGVDIWEKDPHKHTALHIAAERRCNNHEEVVKLQKCIQIILDNLPQAFDQLGSQSIIDDQDDFKETALHDAAQYGNNIMTLALLRHGANIMVMNGEEEPQPPLAFINSSTLETFLDEQLASNGYSPLHSNYTLIFNYSFLASPNTNNQTNEMEALLTMTKPHLRHLLTHPILNSFLYLKWKLIEPVFNLNVVFYVTFVIFLTTYVLITPHKNETEYPTNVSSSLNGTTSENVRNTKQWYAYIIEIVYTCLLLCLAFREIVQMFVLKKMYWKRSENYLDLFILGFGISIICNLSDEVYVHLSITAILLSWSELILLTGSFPILSVQLEMFKQVMITFLRYMAWYFLLIIPFATCFHILFWNMQAEGHNFFNNIWESIFKTTIMLTGEFEASSLDFDSSPGLVHMVLVLFVILMAIVLLNLLNGLAVSDTQLIKDQARVLSLVSMVKLVYHLEWQLHIINDIPPISRIVSKISRIYLFPKSYQKKIYVYNDTKKVKFFFNFDMTNDYKTLYMHTDIIKDAIELLTARKEFISNHASEEVSVIEVN